MHTAQAAEGDKSAKSKPLRVTVYPGKRRGGYSYSKGDSMSAVGEAIASGSGLAAEPVRIADSIQSIFDVAVALTD